MDNRKKIGIIQRTYPCFSTMQNVNRFTFINLFFTFLYLFLTFFSPKMEVNLHFYFR